MPPTTTLLRIAIENGYAYSIVCVLHNAKEYHRYCVQKMYANGVSFDVEYETGGDMKTLVPLFDSRHYGKSL